MGKIYNAKYIKGNTLVIPSVKALYKEHYFYCFGHIRRTRFAIDNLELVYSSRRNHIYLRHYAVYDNIEFVFANVVSDSHWRQSCVADVR